MRASRASSISASPRPTSFAYDLAIAVNDWCIVADAGREGALESERVEALVGAYDACVR